MPNIPHVTTHPVHVEPRPVHVEPSHEPPRVPSGSGERGNAPQGTGASQSKGPVRPGRTGSFSAASAPRGESGASEVNAAGIPRRYVAHPVGDYQTDPTNPGFLVDSGKQRYVRMGGDLFAVSGSEPGGTLRVVMPGEPAKPGIPIERNADGTLHMRQNTGLRGGGGSEFDKARARADVQTKKTELEGKKAEGRAKRSELDTARAAKTNMDARISELDRAKYDATRRFDEASAQTSEYQRKAEQAGRFYEDAKRRYDNTRSMSAGSSDGGMFAGNSANALTSAFSDESTVRDAQRDQRQYDDKRWEWSSKRDEASRELQRIQGEFSAAWRDKVRAEDNISRLENEFASIESERLSRERQLADLERELSRLEAP
jgi:hypothetical protein